MGLRIFELYQLCFMCPSHTGKMGKYATLPLIQIIINPGAKVVILNGAQRSEESPTIIHIADPSLRSG